MVFFPHLTIFQLCSLNETEFSSPLVHRSAGLFIVSDLHEPVFDSPHSRLLLSYVEIIDFE